MNASFNQVARHIKTHWSSIILVCIFLFACILRMHNLLVYDTRWADDGGAHTAYTEIVLQEHRIPTMDETYLAWHEPVYYVLLASWVKIGNVFGIVSFDWWEVSQLVLSMVFLWVVWLVSMQMTKKNTPVSLLVVFVHAVLFIGVKLAAYTTNELLLHALVLLLVYLLYRWNLFEDKKHKLVLFWASLLAIATLVKLTAFVCLIAFVVSCIFFGLVRKRGYYVVYALLAILVVSFVNTPWFLYKQKQFDGSFSINVYEEGHKQTLVESDGWTYLLTFSTQPFTTQPYWETTPYSVVSILVADTASDYYNLFHDYASHQSLPESQRIQTSNGRFTTPALVQAGLWSNRIALILFAMWGIGFFATMVSSVRTKGVDAREWFVYILVGGGVLALMYNVLRMPYIERGVLKMQFIYFALPLAHVVAYRWWWKVLKSRWLRVCILILPIVLYTFATLPIIWL